MAGYNDQPSGHQGFNQHALYGLHYPQYPQPSSALPQISHTTSAPQTQVAPASFDAVNWFDHNTLRKWRDLHFLKIHHINLVESLTFVPETNRKDLYLRLNDVGWPLRLRTPETARNAAMATSGVQWFEEDRNALLALRQFGLSWASIAQTFFPGHTPQDCMEEVIRLGYDPVAVAMPPDLSARSQGTTSVVPGAIPPINAPTRHPTTAAPGFMHYQASTVSTLPHPPTSATATSSRH